MRKKAYYYLMFDSSAAVFSNNCVPFLYVEFSPFRPLPTGSTVGLCFYYWIIWIMRVPTCEKGNLINSYLTVARLYFPINMLTSICPLISPFSTGYSMLFIILMDTRRKSILSLAFAGRGSFRPSINSVMYSHCSERHCILFSSGSFRWCNAFSTNRLLANANYRQRDVAVRFFQEKKVKKMFDAFSLDSKLRLSSSNLGD
jgi:hypothetical protein